MTQLVPSVTDTRPDEEQRLGARQDEPGGSGPFGATQGAQRPPAVSLPQPEETEEEESPAPAGDTSDVPGLEGLEPEFGRRLAAMIRQSGGRITVNSGYRSVEEQARLYQQGVAKYGAAGVGKWVAPPGKSNHNRGLAVDLGGDLALAHRLAPSFGLHFPMAHENWHIEPAGVRAHEDTPAEAYTDPGTKTKPPAQEEIIASFADAMLPTQVNLSGGFGAIQGAQRPPGVALPQEEEEVGAEATEGGDIDSWIAQAIRITGVGEDWAPHLKVIAQRESGFNPKAQNNWDSNAAKGIPSKGLMQTIDPTFNAYKMEGYDDIWNPVHNLIAAINYIKSRYKGNVAGIAGRGGGY